MMFSAEDHVFMSRAIALTAKGRDTSTPNPNVGCVLVKGGRIIGEGWHAKAGEPHAEANALAAASESPEGATAYVTLEPCSHVGRTPPCADALVKAGVARVLAALEDPNPKVKGQGGARLRDAGIGYETGLMEAQARDAHRGYLTRMTKGRPWMRIKAAASLDGRIALANGESKWITGEAARRDVHALRARSCAMLTGIGTVLRDDPELTVRDVPSSRQPRRILIDSRLDIGLEARLLRGEPPIIFTVSEDKAKRALLEGLGAEVVTAPTDPAKPGKTDLAAIARALGERGFNEVTIETGAKLNGSLLAAGVIDEIVLYLAPRFFGDTAQSLFALPEFTSLEQALRPRLVDVRQVGEDLRLTLRMEG
ncbi:Riboflavin biosynthesis protein RibD [Usitatibacter rugosus]|uniref:Riboflavin biosynthesis protein RibD n=1 Tax=Usitatibacter rugosus TaxID=2732067 RepID=A0A6M4GUM7_9PROT|nr:bifunctional diaminohydroxyphosphoribosylaminopyrimidine deaminase/5-amino-6-(5-phosphoribosylamino)uracil reductase RibD [Usitatibacter rugosus]QJR10558.1 Riboflavin biosynthesis protein RibD [Usitatibacter rugosus]